MNKEIFDLLLELASLPPASFASSETPISNLFLQKRTSRGSIISKIPLVAWAIVTGEPLLPSSTSFVPQEETLTKAISRMTDRYYDSPDIFRPQDTLERWLYILEDIDVVGNIDEEMFYFAEHFDKFQLGDYETGMRLWRAMEGSIMDALSLATLWLHYFFIFAVPHKEKYRSFPGICEPRLSTEKMVILAMNDIEQKSNWQQKLQDETIVANWRQECFTQGFTTSMFDWMMKALHFKAKSKEEKTGVQMSPPPSVFHSDALIDENLQSRLNKGFCELMKVNKRFYDWHPGSKQMVLDLVHPSMYCLALGRSHLGQISNESTDPLALAKEFLLWYKGSESDLPLTLFNKVTKTFSSTGSTVAHPICISYGVRMALQLPDLSNKVVEHQYQWLPADVRIVADGKAKILSYINSLKQSQLYSPLQDLVSAFIPMFERVLTFQEDEILRNEVHGSGHLADFRPENFENTAPDQFFDLKSIEEFQEWKEDRLKEGKDIPPCPPPEDEDYDDEYEQEQRHWHSVRTFVPPEVTPFKAPDLEDVKWTKLQDKTIQIIFKLASVELTPEKPEYDGGVWHVEGTYSEQICATGIYYLDSENITDPTLQFRQRIEGNTLPEWNYEQDQFEPMNRLFGHVQRGDDSVQSMYVQLGHLSTPSKRAIVFPNTMQHKLSPFKLINPTKPGHRRMIVMFLVDPDCRITSTAEIAQQQCNEREAAFAFGTTVDELPNIQLGNLTFDISDLIMREVLGKSKEAFEEFKKIEQRKKEAMGKKRQQILDGEESEQWLKDREVVSFSAPMTYEEACWHRARLMQQRSQIMEEFVQEDDEEGWNLCEH
ncbi:uncharacterized protein FA14DRAFT_64352 [Meira miltonrushii]|uniref:Uncharacterized protein n=1 Tax=Meira miltonrushii TaxID=1280837 RepID=A0A316V8V1_9BASI|nr:uncharacterized protein FA14DRAFT_64352 [Meira miltonrushii]PWN33664.1 hypothetical protein FA14DRAFT_64352 [Meira miltonrushii]